MCCREETLEETVSFLGSRAKLVCASQRPAAGKSRVTLFIPTPNPELTVVCQEKSTYWITEVPKNPLNSFDQESLEHPVSSALADPAISLPSLPYPGPSVMMDGYFEGSLTKNHGTEKELTKGGRRTYIVCTVVCSDLTVDWCDVGRVTVDLLPDVALLEIFGFYMDGEVWECLWHKLVHVCQKWRNVIFGSPRRLNLRLYCQITTPVRKTLDVWPPFPIVMKICHFVLDAGNILAALEHKDRICELELSEIPNLEVLEAMQQPFPALKRLRLRFRNGPEPVFTDSFLGGSTPCLQSLFLDNIPFPGLPNLLLSASHLVYLELWNSPDSGITPGYISPEVMATCLSVLTSLERLHMIHIEFELVSSSPDPQSRRPPRPTRTLLPALTDFRFAGDSEYLEDLVARIDAPLLNKLGIFIYLPTPDRPAFDSPQVAQFISRTPKLKAYDEAHGLLDELECIGDISICIRDGNPIPISQHNVFEYWPSD
jgi:hypothetical protein